MALEIAPEKVAHVIIKAREYDVKVGAWDDSREDGTRRRIRAPYSRTTPTIRRVPSCRASSSA